MRDIFKQHDISVTHHQPSNEDVPHCYGILLPYSLPTPYSLPMVLDAASLEAITQEIRICFLYEDAPHHLSVLDAGIRQLRAEDSTTQKPSEYTALMRAAHSLKGGAGIAQFITLRSLAHKLEDLLLALQQKRVRVPNCAFELLSVSVEQIATLIAAATSTQTEAFEGVAAQTTLLPTLTQIESFLQKLLQLEENDENRPTTEQSRGSGEPREAGEQTSKTGVLPTGWKAKILIVDDAIAFRQILERILTEAGYKSYHVDGAGKSPASANSKHTGSNRLFYQTLPRR